MNSNLFDFFPDIYNQIYEIMLITDVAYKYDLAIRQACLNMELFTKKDFDDY